MSIQIPEERERCGKPTFLQNSSSWRCKPTVPSAKVHIFIPLGHGLHRLPSPTISDTCLSYYSIAVMRHHNLGNAYKKAFTGTDDSRG